MSKISNMPIQYPKYSLQNKDSPHWNIGIKYSNGETLYKEIPDDGNDKIAHEEHVLKMFLAAYVGERWGSADWSYVVTGRDGKNGQRHDFNVHINSVDADLSVEIVKLGDSVESHLAHAIRDEVAKHLRKSSEAFFVYANQTTKLKNIKQAFVMAMESDPIDPPDPNVDGDDAVKMFISTIDSEPMPYIRRTNGIPQIHTKSIMRQPLRDAVQRVITQKEKKDYSPLRQEDMILIIDDKSLYISRQYIDECVGLLGFHFMSSRFKEIYIISRKTSNSKNKRAVQEVMFTPVKSHWHHGLFESIIFVNRRLQEGHYLPLNF